MTVAFYSKNNKIKQGTLAKWKQEREASRKSDRKLKRKILVVDDD
jgi:hypothetical protein